jgi:acetyl/propionyl-CoA carboxylase alpha subunit
VRYQVSHPYKTTGTTIVLYILNVARGNKENIAKPVRITGNSAEIRTGKLRNTGDV